jgi:hypothetical protein
VYSMSQDISMTYIRVAYQGIFCLPFSDEFGGDTVRSGCDKKLPT